MTVDNLSKRELYERTGYMNQIVEFKQYVFCEGEKNGVHIVGMWNGNRLELAIAYDRASDISSLRFQGRSLRWSSNLGVSGPEFTGQGGFGRNQNFSGGMSTTCGSTTAGPSPEDGGEQPELHGSMSNLPSEEMGCKTWWNHGNYVVEFESGTRQVRPFEEHLCLTRNIRAKMGDSTVYVHDQVENLGLQDAPLMMIYHMNFEYPLLDEGSWMCLTYGEQYPASKLVEAPTGEIGAIGKPDSGYVARTYNHGVGVDGDGFAYAPLLNERLGIGATVKF